MSRREPTPDEEKEFWMILRASAPSWNALALERLLEYFVKAPATGSADALAVAEAAFPAFANAPLASRAEAMASISSDQAFKQAFKQAKKALGSSLPSALSAPLAPSARARPSPTSRRSIFWTSGPALSSRQEDGRRRSGSTICWPTIFASPLVAAPRPKA